MISKLQKYFEKRLQIMKHYNFYSPFPIFDTEYVQEVKDMINQMKIDKKTEYDEIGVVACKYCNSLYIITDELDNDHCGRCDATNEVVIYKNISEYLKAKEDEE
jgi:hypothetical protein